MEAETRKCCICKVEKSIEGFSFRNKSKNIRHIVCKECHKALVKEHYKNNKQKYIDKAINWNTTNIDRRHEISCKHAKKHRGTSELVRYEMYLKRFLSNAIQLKLVKSRIWKIIGVSGYAEFLQLYPLYGVKGYNIDHIFPLSKCRNREEMTLLHHIDNMRIITAKENSAKRNYITEEGLIIFNKRTGYNFVEEN